VKRLRRLCLRPTLRARARIRRRRDRARRDCGQVTPFVVILSTALIAFAGLVFDAGMALSAKTQALDAAQAAARSGAQELDLLAYRTTGVARLDPARARATALHWLTAAGLRGEASATTAVVTVTVRRSHRTQLLGLVGVSRLDVSATATATARQGPAPGQP
jgi:hypothetical protein